ncbi:kinase-like protein [Pleomassaria siparia CBS 279.74]|uniref:Kinase-like protein n=1 Tax=Pleomassaria siparia CBS 279.74 TaxID=1314801 RepID=A0A6G1KGK5_9PLEO|nr:kinase-like protein [Pleomassaria siparia CBS 279.74]
MEKVDDLYGVGATDAIPAILYQVAPEVLHQGGTGYTAKAVIWSLGSLLLELLMGRQPFSKEDVIDSTYKLGSMPELPRIPDDVTAEIDATALAFIYNCWTVDPVERPTAETMLRAPFLSAFSSKSDV